jgi:hypothetical protein
MNHYIYIYIYIYVYIYIYINIIYTKWDAHEVLLKSSLGVCVCLRVSVCASAFSVLHPSRAAPSCSLTIVI